MFWTRKKPLQLPGYFVFSMVSRASCVLIYSFSFLSAIVKTEELLGIYSCLWNLVAQTVLPRLRPWTEKRRRKVTWRESLTHLHHSPAQTAVTCGCLLISSFPHMLAVDYRKPGHAPSCLWLLEPRQDWDLAPLRKCSVDSLQCQCAAR